MVWQAKRKWSWRRQSALWNSMITLAAWRWRTQRFLLLVTGVGIAISVALIASLPLFSSVLSTAGLRGVLRAQPDSSQIISGVTLQGISSEQVASASAQVNHVIKRDMGQYLAGTPQTTLITGNWYLNHGGFTMDFYGVPIQTAQAHLQLLQGHLPAESSSSSSDIDIMLTRTAAFYMGGVDVGATIPLAVLLFTKPATNTIGAPGGPVPYVNVIKAHVAGIFQTKPGDAYWNGYTLEASPPVARLPPPPFLALTSQSALLKMLDTISQQQKAAGIFFSDRSLNFVYLSYTLNTSAITGGKLDDLISHLGNLQQDVYRAFIPGTVQGGEESNIAAVDLFGSMLHGLDTDSTLEKFRGQEQIIQTPMLILTAEITGLILFFVSTMMGALVEREQTSIAIMRSRGSSRLQICGSLLIQGLVICLLAGFAGSLLAVGLVSLVVPHFLTPATGDAFNALILDPGLVLRSLGLYTLVASAAAFFTLLLTIYLAVNSNILTQRREEARATRLPLWQRLRLDLVIVALAIAGYVLIFYLESVQQLLSAQAQTLVSAPLELLAPLLLLLAGILLFLRFFPLVARLFARLARRRRDLTIMLALTQVERAPRQPMRMALLLGLATAFALFSLVFSASQSQRTQDLATYQAVSDFSGFSASLPGTTLDNTASVLNQASSLYRQIQGVTSATIGSMANRYLFINSGTTQAYTRKTILSAVDASTFAQTALWTSQDSSQSLSDLMALLVSSRQQAVLRGVVPALVASSTWQLLGLTPGMTFHLTNEFGSPDSTVYVALAEVNHIPPVDDSTQGAILVDYQSLVAGRARYQEATRPNYVWLRTSDNPIVVNHVRLALNNPALALTSLVDRYELGNDNAVDPLVNNLLSILSIGVVAALLLAFLANLLLPLISVRLRQTHFAVLRALGTPPGQITRILAWELAIILSTALLLGLFFGLLLAFTSVPPLIFTGVIPANLADISSTAIYTLQHILPVTIVMPSSLLVALVTLLALCLLALGLMTHLAQRPLIAQSLLLDND